MQWYSGTNSHSTPRWDGCFENPTTVFRKDSLVPQKWKEIALPCRGSVFWKWELSQKSTGSWGRSHTGRRWTSCLPSGLTGGHHCLPCHDGVSGVTGAFPLWWWGPRETGGCFPLGKDVLEETAPINHCDDGVPRKMVSLFLVMVVMMF